jgi:hypothetical protein
MKLNDYLSGVTAHRVGGWRRKAVYLGLPLMLLLWMGSAPRVQISTSEIDLGEVRRGELLHKTLLVTNGGLRALKVGTEARTCGVRATIGTPSGVLKGGSTVRVRVDIDTTLFPEGKSVKELMIPTNAPLRRSVLVTVRADVHSDVDVSPRVLYLSSESLAAEARLHVARGSGAEPVSIRTTDPLVTAHVEQVGTAEDYAFVVVARAHSKSPLPWNLGTIVIGTNSQTTPELRIPVRGSLPIIQ